MESAVQIQDEGVSARVIKCPIKWKINKNNKKAYGEFKLSLEFITERFLKFIGVDEEEEARSRRGDYLCVRHCPSSDGIAPTWVAHCHILEVKTVLEELEKKPGSKNSAYTSLKHKLEKKATFGSKGSELEKARVCHITFEVHQATQDIPSELVGSTRKCVLEWLPKSLPIRYQYIFSCGELMPYPWHCPSSIVRRPSCVVCVHHNYQK